MRSDNMTVGGFLGWFAGTFLCCVLGFVLLVCWLWHRPGYEAHPPYRSGHVYGEADWAAQRARETPPEAPGRTDAPKAVRKPPSARKGPSRAGTARPETVRQAEVASACWRGACYQVLQVAR